MNNEWEFLPHSGFVQQPSQAQAFTWGYEVIQYRRSNITRSSYFFTANLAERHKQLLIEHIGALRQAVRMVKQWRPFHIDAMVVLPDHLHTIWTLPAGDKDYPTH